MAGEDKKTTTKTAPQKDSAVKDKSAPPADTGAPASPAPAADTKASPSTYSRGEGQKPVTPAYRENWNSIFGKKTGANRKSKNSGKNKGRRSN
jgi:hypothetical protein